MEESAATTRTIWGLGDYHRFAKATVWGVGPELVAACGISAGQSVLDVAAGSGNVALRAAQAGARVVASDLAPENLASGRREAAALGLELDWVEADAQALPFADGQFDVVTSSFGVMWAADPRAAAAELVRVCRPRGTIGLASFTPEGLIPDFLAPFLPYLPAPPPGTPPPTAWGSEEGLRELLGDRVASVTTARASYVERSPSPQRYCAFFKETFGPVIAIFAGLSDQPERAAALDRDFLALARRADSGPPGGPSEYIYEYLLAVARTRE